MKTTHWWVECIYIFIKTLDITPPFVTNDRKNIVIEIKMWVTIWWNGRSGCPKIFFWLLFPEHFILVPFNHIHFSLKTELIITCLFDRPHVGAKGVQGSQTTKKDMLKPNLPGYDGQHCRHLRLLQSLQSWKHVHCISSPIHSKWKKERKWMTSHSVS